MLWLLPGYFVAALVVIAILGRLRPSWFWVTLPADKSDWRLALNVSDRIQAQYWGQWPSLHERDLAALKIKAEANIKAAGDGNHGPLRTGAILRAIFAPVLLLTALPVDAVLNGTRRSLNEKITTRAALEAELAAARKEVDALLRKDP